MDGRLEDGKKAMSFVLSTPCFLLSSPLSDRFVLRVVTSFKKKKLKGNGIVSSQENITKGGLLDDPSPESLFVWRLRGIEERSCHWLNA